MLMTRIQMLKSMIRSEKGQGMVEYGLILAVIAVVAIGAFTTMGTSLSTKMGDVNTSL